MDNKLQRSKCQQLESQDTGASQESDKNRKNITLLADDNIRSISSFLDIRGVHHFGCTQSRVVLLIKKLLLELISYKKKWVLKWFPNIICDLMSGPAILIFAPILDYKDYFCYFEYIDNIKVSDVGSPIMVGVDVYQRPFISIRTCESYTKNIGDKETSTSSDQKINSVVTIFQRYTKDKTVWTHGTCYSSNLTLFIKPRIICNNLIQDKLLKENIYNLIQNKQYINSKRYNKETRDYQLTKISSVLI